MVERVQAYPSTGTFVFSKDLNHGRSARSNVITLTLGALFLTRLTINKRTLKKH